MQTVRHFLNNVSLKSCISEKCQQLQVFPSTHVEQDIASLQNEHRQQDEVNLDNPQEQRLRPRRSAQKKDDRENNQSADLLQLVHAWLCTCRSPHHIGRASCRER